MGLILFRKMTITNSLNCVCFWMLRSVSRLRELMLLRDTYKQANERTKLLAVYSLTLKTADWNKLMPMNHFEWNSAVGDLICFHLCKNSCPKCQGEANVLNGSTTPKIVPVYSIRIDRRSQSDGNCRIEFYFIDRVLASSVASSSHRLLP